MSEQFWSDERVMGRYRDFVECNGAEYAEIAWQSVIREMRDEYEAALDGARSWCKTAEENDELRKRIADLEAQPLRYASTSIYLEPAPITASYGPHLPPERAIRIALDWAEDQEIITEDDRKAALDWLYGQREGQGEL